MGESSPSFLTKHIHMPRSGPFFGLELSTEGPGSPDGQDKGAQPPFPPSSFPLQLPGSFLNGLGASSHLG